MKKSVISFGIRLGLFLMFFFALALSAAPASASVDPNVALQAIAQDLHFFDDDERAVLASEDITTDDKREYHRLTLQAPNAGTIQLMVSGPLHFTDGPHKYPVLFISAGFLSGMASVHMAGDPGNMILVGFEYPTTTSKIEDDPSLLLKAIRVVPAQLSLTLEWLRNQTYVDRNKFSVMGVSLGSLFLPVSLRLAALRGIVPTTTIFAFGGAQVIPVLDGFLVGHVNDFTKALLLQGASGLLSLHDPQLHLPFLQGPFDCIYGTQDQVFPRESSLAQYSALRDPKEIHWVNSRHIDSDQTQTIQETMRLVFQFLQTQNAL